MYDQELSIAKKAALAAGAFLDDHPKINVDSSIGKDIKLSSDKGSEKIILAILKESNLPILSEECGSTQPLGETYWIVDPLDGSMNYLKGMYELTCVSIALWDAGEPVLGVVYRWFTKELFWGCKGEGAFLNQMPISVSQQSKVESAIIATGFPVKRNYSFDSLAFFINTVQKFKKVRMLGAAALMCSYVAAGKVDAYFEEDIMLWDIAAASAIVMSAGGVCRIQQKQDYKCLCSCFSTQALMDDLDYHSSLTATTKIDNPILLEKR